jgi:hypothetical protein
MVSYPRRLQSGHITCYLNRTYHVLTTVGSILAITYNHSSLYPEFVVTWIVT